MPEADTDTRAGLDLAAYEFRNRLGLALREGHNSNCKCTYCDFAAVFAEARRLQAVADVARRLTFALDRRSGDAGGLDAADRVEQKYGNYVACLYFDLCEAMAGRGTPLCDMLDGKVPPAPSHVAGDVAESANLPREG